MKLDTRYGGIWDELSPKPAQSAKTERRVPQTQEEAIDFYEAAESSMHRSLMKTWDRHNEMMRKSAELREIARRKKVVELQAQQARERQREFLAESAEDKKAEQRRKDIKARS